MSYPMYGMRCELCQSTEHVNDIIYEDGQFICIGCIDDYREERDNPDPDSLFYEDEEYWDRKQ